MSPYGAPDCEHPEFPSLGAFAAAAWKDFSTPGSMKKSMSMHSQRVHAVMFIVSTAPTSAYRGAQLRLSTVVYECNTF